MDVNLLFFAVAALLFIGLFAAGYAILQRRPRVRERVQDGSRHWDPDEEGRFEGAERILEPLGKKVISVRGEKDLREERRKLISAGYRRKNAVVLFYGARIVVMIAGFALLALLGTWQANPFLFVLLPVFMGMALPDIWLRLKISQRKEAIQLALPDMMDLAVVCVEAGMGLDQALQRIGNELRSTHPDLSEELHLYNLETNAGLPRSQALRNLASRTDVEDVKSLSGTLIQADRFGTSIAQSLRIFSDSLRTKRRQRAEEKAAKLNIKIIVPLVLFIFPSIFIVVGGPAIIRLVRELLPLLAGTS